MDLLEPCLPLICRPLPWLCRPLGGVEAVAVLRGGGQPLTLGSLARACLINDTCHSVKREGWVHDVWLCWGAGEIDCLAWSVSLSRSLSHSLVPLSEFRMKCWSVVSVCLGAREQVGFSFFVLVYCSISLFFSHTVLFFKKGRGNRPTKERKEKKNYVWERNRQVLKKTWLRVVREGEVINQSQVWQQRDYYFK